MSLTVHLHCNTYQFLWQAVKDWMLVAIVCILVAIDVVLMILTLSVPQLRVGAVLVHDLVNPKSETGVS